MQVIRLAVARYRHWFGNDNVQAAFVSTSKEAASLARSGGCAPIWTTAVTRSTRPAIGDRSIDWLRVCVVGDYLLFVVLNFGRSSEVANVLKNVNRSLEMADCSNRVF